MSVAKIGAILGLIFGLIEGIIIGAIAGVAGAAATAGFHPFMMGLGIWGLIVFFAIVVGLIGGFVGGAIWAFVYNCAAGFVGPIEAELDAKA
jgi:hypothetical protein